MKLSRKIKEDQAKVEGKQGVTFDGVAAHLRKLQKNVAEKAKLPHKVELRCSTLEQERIWWEKEERLHGAVSLASEEESLMLESHS